MLQSNMAITIQNGRLEMFQSSYLSRYFTVNENCFSVYYSPKNKESKSDILINFGIQDDG